MNIHEIVETTEKIVIERGKAKLTLDCYLERISAENPDYEALQSAERKAKVEDEAALAMLQKLTSADYIIMQLVDKTGKELPVKAMAAKSAEIEAQYEPLAAKRKGTEAIVLRNKCDRIVYLTKSWDVTETVEGDEVALPITTDNLMKYFSPLLITTILAKIEQTVFGLFTQTPNSITSSYSG